MTQGNGTSNVEIGAFGDTLSPSQLLLSVSKQGLDDASTLVIAWVSKDGHVSGGWSSKSSLNALGLLEVIKAQLIASTYEDAK